MLSVEFDEDALLLFETTEMASETKVTNMKISSDYKISFKQSNRPTRPAKYFTMVKLCGSLLTTFLIIQILTGIFLSIHYARHSVADVTVNGPLGDVVGFACDGHPPPG